MKQRPDLPGPRLPEGTQRALLQKPTTMRATLRTILAVGEATPGAAAKMRSDALEGAYMGFRRGVMQHISARVVSQHTGCTLHVQRGTVTFGSHACAETEEMYVLPRALNDDPTAAGGKSHHTWSDVAFCVPKEAAAGAERVSHCGRRAARDLLRLPLDERAQECDAKSGTLPTSARRAAEPAQGVRRRRDRGVA